MTSASSYKQADVKKTKAEQRNHGNSEKSKTREQMNTEQQNFKTYVIIQKGQLPLSLTSLTFINNILFVAIVWYKWIITRCIIQSYI